ncbi:MAG: DNA-3-methyladenine glycosylase I [Burkholderiaceae bacterium]|nr:DNA-3-methyladenine glycosylase I [Burkholderiaceae bacterium]
MPLIETPGLFTADDGRPRCFWCAATPTYRHYHDTEWGFPVTDERRLFEKLCLEGFQAGLSWLTILNKREAFRRAFAGFDASAVASFGPADVERLLQDAGIVRHRGKIESTINNAQRLPELQREFGSLAAYAWRFAPKASSRPKRMTLAALKALGSSPESSAMSKDLKRRGWSFVGPTTVYAFMQAMGLVNDHIEGCHVRAAADAARAQSGPQPGPQPRAEPLPLGRMPARRSPSR